MNPIIIDKNQHNDVNSLVKKKTLFFQDVIQNTILYVQQNKIHDILGVSEVNNCIQSLHDISNILMNLNNNKLITTDDKITKLQEINNDLSMVLKSYGTNNLEDLLGVCYGNYNLNLLTNSEIDIEKFDLLKKYFHPTSYKIIINKKGENDKKNIKNYNDDNILNENSKNLDCLNLPISIKSFHLKVYGIQLIIHNNIQKRSLIINGLLDDVIVNLLNNKYLNDKIKYIKDNIPNEGEFKTEYFFKYIENLTLKELMIYKHSEIYGKYIGYVCNLNNIRLKSINQTIKEFMSGDLFNKRLIIIQLLTYFNKNENLYLAYLLYDLLSNELNGNIDTQEQIILFDSLPWNIKHYFKDAMKKTIQYTNDLSNFDIQKIPLEQQICLLKSSESVKEKAMQKLKEVKSKSDDSGSKARQYLDGLLKIPFNIYKREPILYKIETIKNQFNNLIITHKLQNIPFKDNYTSLEILYYLNKINENIEEFINPNYKINIFFIKKKISNTDKIALNNFIEKLIILFNKYNLKFNEFKNYNINKKSDLKKTILSLIENLQNAINLNEKDLLIKDINSIFIEQNYNLIKFIDDIKNNYNFIQKYMDDIKISLDKAVHGHEKAKKQIFRIIGQWINGEQDGYCFGFEGPPGVGKTSLAKKGLSNCLKDDEGNSRPFAMIQIGGDSNGSSLHGHNYTYVGSTWGSIVQILMDKKCLNPIIFIDEIDKISKTENGKEIIGILTHLLDPSQNDCFQDKYYTGIDLDLSKALFILSYNDVDAIDRVLLDRIHRIKFKNLLLEDKLTICKTHILPEIYKKMGLIDMIIINDDVLKVIIDEYTSEPGVRKLKEILFEIIGEINLNILNFQNEITTLPIIITINDIKEKYFKDKHETLHKKVHLKNSIGIINGLWANNLGLGGVIPIQCNYFPSEKFLNLKLTGLQGDVMKESMNVACTLAWNLTNNINKQKINNNVGLHIHCPEGSVPKDGPSAGTAITVCIYSVLNNIKIKSEYAITGEISLDGNITAIGGLDLKILGGIKANVKHFIYPKDNSKDFNEFIEKYNDNPILNGIFFHSVENLNEVFNLILDY